MPKLHPPTLSAAMYAWQLEPQLTSAVWGGSELVSKYGKNGDPNTTLGESWECWDADVVANGPLKGSTVAMLRERLRSSKFNLHLVITDTITIRRFGTHHAGSGSGRSPARERWRRARGAPAKWRRESRIPPFPTPAESAPAERWGRRPRHNAGNWTYEVPTAV